MLLELKNENDNGPLFDFLHQQRIVFQCRDHQPVNTVEDSKKLKLGMIGGATKNLFLRDRKGERHFLFCVEQEKKVDLKQISSLLELSRLSFASPERLKRYLGILPGSVSLLALINDPKGRVGVLIDEDLWQEKIILCHPLVNSSTIAMSRIDLEQFIHKTGHQYQLVQVPLSKTA